MTIRQNGGIFGRNPTFNNVTVDGTLTVDQIVEKTSAAGITLDGVTLKDGNVVLANGKGIDFSATSGTGTSELFDDYEEGTWTPTLIAGTTDFTSVTYDVATGGRYTKVGNLVHIQGFIRTDAVTVGAAAGDIFIGGLPFTSVSNTSPTQNGQSSVTIGRAADWASDQPISGRIGAIATRIELYKRLSSNAATINLVVADVGTGADDNATFFAATYVSA